MQRWICPPYGIYPPMNPSGPSATHPARLVAPEQLFGRAWCLGRLGDGRSLPNDRACGSVMRR